MKQLGRRLDALEQGAGADAVHCILRYENQTEAEALLAYESDHGAIALGPQALRIFINKPFPLPAA